MHKAILTVLLTLFLASFSSAGAWNGITPLISTKADVEKIMGPCMEHQFPSSCTYHLADRRVTVIFSSAEACTDRDQWLSVPSGTVKSIQIAIDPKVQILLSDSGYDLSTFRVVDDDDPRMLGWQYYTNSAEGVMLLVESGSLREVHLSWRREDGTRFACPTNRPSTKEDIFWDWFRAHQSRIYADDLPENAGIMDELRSELLKVDPNLTIEIWPKQAGYTKRGVVFDDKVTPYDSKAISAMLARVPKLAYFEVNKKLKPKGGSFNPNIRPGP